MSRPSGVKAFAVVAKPAHSSKTNRVGLGKFGRVPLTVREAADKQKQLHQKDPIPSIESEYTETLAKLDKGEDLRKKTLTQTSGHSFRGGDPIPTLKKAYNDYMKEGDLAANSVKSYETAINHLESWWELRITDITPKMVLARHKELTDKTLVDVPKGSSGGRRLRGGPVVANIYAACFTGRIRSCRTASWNWMNIEINLPPNPVAKAFKKARGRRVKKWNIEKPRENVIEREQMPAWFEAIQQLPEIVEDYRNRSPAPWRVRDLDGALGADYLTFVLLSGLRRREATGILWENVDFKNGWVTIPETKNREPLRIPMSDEMVSILSRRKQAGGDGPFSVPEPANYIRFITERTGIEHTVHDLRRSYISLANSLDVALPKIKALVNHGAKGPDVGRT